VIVEFGNKFSAFAKQPFVIDNTNVTRSERARYVEVAKVARPQMVGYSFQSTMTRQLIREKGIASTYKGLQLSQLDGL
jgi:hypothetical protein